MLADDNLGFLDAAHRFLDAHHIRIVGEARTGREALGLIEVLKPDLLLLDLEMPELDGWYVLQQIERKRDRPRVIIVTQHDQDEYRTRAAQAGADGFVSKREFTTALMPLIHNIFSEAPNERLT